jgi:hypothetical protein
MILLNVYTNPNLAEDFQNVPILLDDPQNPGKLLDQQQKLTFSNAVVEKVEFETPTKLSQN